MKIPKKGEILTSKGLYALYGSWYKDSLIKSHLSALPKTRQKGEKTRWLVLHDLPSFELLTELMNKKYTTTVQEVLDASTSEIESLSEEISDWKDSIPENLQGGDKYYALEDVESELSSIDFGIDLSDEMKKTNVTILPRDSKSSSRASRIEDITYALELVCKALEIFKEEKVESSIQDLIWDLNNIEFPTAFS